MENASKALLMAAGVLMAVVILSLAAYLFGTFSSSTAEMQKDMERAEIQNFNNQFYAYNGKDNLTIYDVYTVVNLARNNNEKHELVGEGIKNDNLYVAVYIGSDSSNKGLEATDFKIDNTNLENYMPKKTTAMSTTQDLQLYKCTVKMNSTTQRINKVIFTKK